MENFLDKATLKALLLYQKEEGVPFSELNIDNSSFLFLDKNKYITEPQGRIQTTCQGCFPIHGGNVQITPIGKAYIEQIKEKEKLTEIKNRRYWITTGIALAALIKSFWPEIISMMEIILK